MMAGRLENCDRDEAVEAPARGRFEHLRHLEMDLGVEEASHQHREQSRMHDESTELPRRPAQEHTPGPLLVIRRCTFGREKLREHQGEDGAKVGRAPTARGEQEDGEG
jgi:hypothetical protein